MKRLVYVARDPSGPNGRCRIVPQKIVLDDDREAGEYRWDYSNLDYLVDLVAECSIDRSL